jgi:hypothetical protein
MHTIESGASERWVHLWCCDLMHGRLRRLSGEWALSSLVREGMGERAQRVGGLERAGDALVLTYDVGGCETSAFTIPVADVSAMMREVKWGGGSGGELTDNKGVAVLGRCPLAEADRAERARRWRDRVIARRRRARLYDGISVELP